MNMGVRELEIDGVGVGGGGHEGLRKHGSDRNLLTIAG